MLRSAIPTRVRLNAVNLSSQTVRSLLAVAIGVLSLSNTPMRRTHKRCFFKYF